MTKKILFTPENPKGIISDMTAEEIQQTEQDVITGNNVKNEEQAKEDLKASAKAKLIAGEALTEDEANTIVL
jgi:glycerol-3-phosphate responsive antiterminator